MTFVSGDTSSPPSYPVPVARRDSRSDFHRRLSVLRKERGLTWQTAFEHKLATAETDDEPFTDEDRRDIEAAHEWFKHNEGTPFEQVVAELGFTMDDIRNYKDPEEAKGEDHD